MSLERGVSVNLYLLTQTPEHILYFIKVITYWISIVFNRYNNELRGFDESYRHGELGRFY
jgi:hypothetical protein